MLALKPSNVTKPISFDSPIPSTTTDAMIQLTHLLLEVDVLKIRITAAQSAPRMPRKFWANCSGRTASPREKTPLKTGSD